MGQGGVDCQICNRPDADYVWTDERWRLCPTNEPTGLPLVLLLETREHYGEPGDLPDQLARELGALQCRIERMRTLEGVGRIHVCRWGDGAEHLHWWFMARPARLPQLLGSFAAIWDDILPPTPREIWQSNIDSCVAALQGE